MPRVLTKNSSRSLNRGTWFLAIWLATLVIHSTPRLTEVDRRKWVQIRGFMLFFLLSKILNLSKALSACQIKCNSHCEKQQHFSESCHSFEKQSNTKNKANQKEKREWPDGLRRYTENRKDPGSDSTRCLAGLSDPTSLQYSRWPLGQIKNITQWLTSD